MYEALNFLFSENWEEKLMMCTVADCENSHNLHSDVFVF